MQKWNHCFLNFQISFGRGYDQSTADIQTETGRFSTKFMLDLELYGSQNCSELPWVPETFHARFPVSSLQCRGIAEETSRFD